MKSFQSDTMVSHFQCLHFQHIRKESTRTWSWIRFITKHEPQVDMFCLKHAIRYRELYDNFAIEVDSQYKYIPISFFLLLVISPIIFHLRLKVIFYPFFSLQFMISMAAKFFFSIVQGWQRLLDDFIPTVFSCVCNMKRALIFQICITKMIYLTLSVEVQFLENIIGSLFLNIVYWKPIRIFLKYSLGVCTVMLIKQ
jgi:hypothetical protein